MSCTHVVGAASAIEHVLLAAAVNKRAGIVSSCSCDDKLRAALILLLGVDEANESFESIERAAAAAPVEVVDLTKRAAEAVRGLNVVSLVPDAD